MQSANITTLNLDLSQTERMLSTHIGIFCFIFALYYNIFYIISADSLGINSDLGKKK